MWVLSVGLMVTFLLLLFPTGRPPSPRWRIVGWIAGLAIPLTMTAIAITVWPVRFTMDPDSDVGFGPATALGLLVIVAAAIASIASLVVRFRRATGDERQQLRWFIAAAVFTVLGLILSIANFPGGEVIFIVGFLSLAAAAGLAILKYRLYDFDLVLKKTVVITLLAVFILVLYVGVIALASASTLGAGVGAVVLAITFQPVRSWARRMADRVVYGKRATPYEVLTRFSDQLAEDYATEDVAPKMAQMLAAATGADTARVWLRIGGELRPQAAWPEHVEPVPGVPLGGSDALPEMASSAFEVRDQGELLGALSVDMPANDPMNPERERLVRDLASQAGLVLRNVRLIEDLRASRQRLVSAQDEERRKIERNLHDGAQQQLVALAIKVNLAQSLAEKDPARAAAMMGQVKGELQESLETLRDLARGIYPPLLADQGLAAALEAQSRRAAVPTTVTTDGIARYSQETEAAAYFCCLEALQNIAKYANATRATIALSASEQELTFAVTDDGDGFDTTSTNYGTGMQGMSDRLDAIGGRLDVQSTPGAGTTVTGTLPVGAVVKS
jgi:signal transduction histidine kinase